MIQTKIMRMLPFLMILGSALAAEGLSQKDRDFTMSHLHGTRKLVLDAVEDLKPQQCSFKPAPDRWSICEVVEHLVVTEKGLLPLAQKQPSPSSAAGERYSDDQILKNVSSRAEKVKTPEMFQPKGTLSRDEVLAQFKQTRDTTIAFIRDTQDDLRARVSTSPAGPSDPVQWLLFISGHTSRHLDQIAEIRADSKYPK